tara:strand:- start:1521 stop:1850 length:330 start_codon:yes stop_codon:yes gene_type:complete
MKWLLYVGLVIGVMSSASAGYRNGNNIFKLCTTEKSDSLYYINLAECDGYITGVVDLAASEKKLCSPKQVTIGQLRDITVKWLSDNPQHRHFTANSLVIAALIEAYPCK